MAHLQVATAGRRDGNAVQAEWDEMQSRMEPVLLRLNERATGPKFDKRGLSQLLGGLHQFMQNALGIQVGGSGPQRWWSRVVPVVPRLPPLPPPGAPRQHPATPRLPLPCMQAQYKTFTRLPLHLLQDFSPDGPVLTIGGACGDYLWANPKLKRIDWFAPDQRKQVCVCGGGVGYVCVCGVGGGGGMGGARPALRCVERAAPKVQRSHGQVCLL